MSFTIILDVIFVIEGRSSDLGMYLITKMLFIFIFLALVLLALSFGKGILETK
jgi:hypothetical protein